MRRCTSRAPASRIILSLAAGSAADDGVVHHDHPLAAHHIGNGIELELTPKCRIDCDGSMNVRDVMLRISPRSYGMRSAPSTPGCGHA